MTKRLTPEEKARRATRRALLRLPPRERFYATSGLTPRTKAETLEYLAMIERQRVETVARGQRIAAAYALNDRRLGAELEQDEVRVQWPGDADLTSPAGTPLATRIAIRAALMSRAPNAFMTRAPLSVREQPGTYTPPKWREHWWQFWRKPWNDGE